MFYGNKIAWISFIGDLLVMIYLPTTVPKRSGQGSYSLHWIAPPMGAFIMIEAAGLLESNESKPQLFDIWMRQTNFYCTHIVGKHTVD